MEARRRRIGVEGQRVRLVRAAAEAFAARGFDACSVENVLESARVSRQTFYRCFSSKEALFHDVHADVSRGVIQSVAALPDADLDPATSIRRHFEVLFERAREVGPIVCELEREAARPSSPYHVHREERRRYGIEYARGWVLRHYGVNADRELTRAVVYAIEQLILATAEARTQTAVASGIRAATLLVQAALLRMGVEPETSGEE
jgi:AcrR family transcriptional regulator